MLMKGLKHKIKAPFAYSRLNRYLIKHYLNSFDLSAFRH